MWAVLCSDPYDSSDEEDRKVRTVLISLVALYFLPLHQPSSKVFHVDIDLEISAYANARRSGLMVSVVGVSIYVTHPLGTTITRNMQLRRNRRQLVLRNRSCTWGCVSVGVVLYMGLCICGRGLVHGVLCICGRGLVHGVLCICGRGLVHGGCVSVGVVLCMGVVYLWAWSCTWGLCICGRGLVHGVLCICGCGLVHGVLCICGCGLVHGVF